MMHFLCGTCAGEFERHYGYFESAKRREEMGLVVQASRFANDDEHQVYCCNCGQQSYVAATFEAEPGKGPCDGQHKEVER